MGWDGSGNYSRIHNFSADASAGIKILASRMDEEINDMASAFTRVWTRDGQNTPTQDLPMGGRKFVNVGAPTSVNNFIRSREVIENVPIFMQDTASSADRISVSAQYFTSVSANQAPGDGTKIMVRVLSHKSSAVLYLDGHSANIEQQDGNRIGAAMVSGGIYELTYSSVDTAWKLPKPDDGRTPAEISAGVTPVDIQYEYGHVKRYGTTLNSATLQAALNANAGNFILLADGETHTVSTAITWPANTHIRVANGGSAILDLSAAVLSGSGHIVSQGTLGSSLGGGLASNVSAGAVTATLNSAPTLSPGDLLILRNPTDGSWNADNVSYRQGEFLTVKSVSGAVVTFTSAVIDAYASASCTLHKVTPTSSSMVGNIEIRGNTADTSNIPTVYIKYGHGNVINGVKFRNTTASCLELNDCYDAKVSIDTGKFLTDAGSIEATGVIANGQKITVHDSVLHGDRHGASTGGGGAVVGRFVRFQRCAISSRNSAAADFHGSAEFCEYSDCHIDGAVNLSGARNKLLRNTIYPHASITALINFDAARSIEQTIEGNHLYMRGTAVRVLDANASTDINANTTDAGTFRFHRNVIVDEKAADATYLFIRNNGSTAAMEMSIIGNEVRKTNTSFYGSMLAVSVVSGSNFSRIIYEDQQHVDTGFGIVSGVSVVRVNGSLGLNIPGSDSPAFGTALFEPSVFHFDKRLTLATPGTEFGILTVPDNNTFLPLAVAGRVDVDVTATTGNFLSVGVNAANRRADFGAFAVAAASSLHSKNSAMRFVNSSELANQIVAAAESLSLLSVDVTTDGAVIASNVGGASQTVTMRVQGRMSGNLPSLP